MSKSFILRLIAAVVLLGTGAWIGSSLMGRPGGMFDAVLPKRTVDEKVTLSVLRSEALTFLVTRRTTTQIVVEHREADWLGQWQGVLWATVNWTWGVDLSKLTEKDLRREGEVIFVRLPEPQMLDFGIEPGSQNFFSKSTVVPKLQEVFNTGQQQKILQDEIHARSMSFARDNKLCPTREQMVRQLNETTSAFKKATGMELRFE